MARIRTVKPDYWTDERVGECSVSARLLFIACWNFADDHGGLDRSSKQLKAQAFPYDAIDCEPLVQELLSTGLLVEYTVNSKKYLHIKGFRKHQKVEKPAKPRVPVYDDSLKSRGVLGEDSPRSSGSLLEGKGREGKVKEGAARQTEIDWSAISGLDLESWNVWLAYRRKAGHKRYVDDRMAKRLAPYPREVQAAAIDESITQQYTGLFPEKVKPNGTHQQGGHETAYERSGRRLREWAAANGVDAAVLG
jgi:hypothetical protein